MDLDTFLERFGVERGALKQYGVKGMHWGVRKRRTSAGGPTRVKLDDKPGKGLKTSGGERHPAHRDAKIAAVARQKAVKSGSHSLSDKELKLLLNRLDMEQRYRKLNPPKPTVKSFIAKQLKEIGDQELKKIARGDLSTVETIDAFLNNKSSGKHRKKK